MSRMKHRAPKRHVVTVDYRLSLEQMAGKYLRSSLSDYPASYPDFPSARFGSDRRGVEKIEITIFERECPLHIERTLVWLRRAGFRAATLAEVLPLGHDLFGLYGEGAKLLALGSLVSDGSTRLLPYLRAWLDEDFDCSEVSLEYQRVAEWWERPGALVPAVRKGKTRSPR